MHQEIIEEYEEKSKELLEYLNSMEAQFEHQQQEYEQLEVVLQHENAALIKELAWKSKVAKRKILAKTNKQKCEGGQDNKIDVMHTIINETRQYELNYQMEHNRVEV